MNQIKSSNIDKKGAKVWLFFFFFFFLRPLVVSSVLWRKGQVWRRTPPIGGVLFSSVSQSCLTLCDYMYYSTPGFPVHHQLLELAQTRVHRVSEAIQPSNCLSPPSSPAFSLWQDQGLFQWISSSHQVDKVLEPQPQHQSFWWIFRTDFF